MDILKTLAEEFKIKEEQVKETVALIDEGNTIPFISRYRKEVTGGLDDATLRDLNDRLNYLRKMDERRVKKVLPHYLRHIEKRGQNLELCFHPGYFERDEALMNGTQKGFDKFYYSPGRVDEFHALLNLKNQTTDRKEGCNHALH